MFASCKKADDKPQGKYTVQGKVLFDTSSMPYKNVPVELTVTRGSQSTFVSKTLGTATTNNSGWFSITYDAIDITGGDAGGGNQAQVHLSSQWFIYDNLPANQNVNRTFVRPVKGRLRISLSSKRSLESNHDTLYLAYLLYSKNSNGYIVTIDTFTKTFNGVYKTIEAPLYHSNLFWGIGKNNLVYDALHNGFTKYQGTQGVDVSGDPTINNVTINY